MSGDLPSVSLVMPVWQPRKDWLTQAVESALAQVDCTFELIVVDDGNDDRVDHLLDAIDDPRLRQLRIDHAGVSAARNAGTAASRGTHLRFVDADDVIEPQSSARLLASAHGTYIAHERTVVCDPQLQPLGSILGSPLEGSIAVDCVMGRLEVHLGAMMFPRHVVDVAGPWDESLRVSQDWDFILRCLEHAEARSGAGVASHYRRHPDSATGRPTALAYGSHGTRRTVEKYFERHPEQRGTAIERAAWTNLFVVQARSALHHGNFRTFSARAARVTVRSPSAGLRLCTEGGRWAARRLLAKSHRRDHERD